MFTNTQFFDFDAASQSDDLHLGGFASSSNEPARAPAAAPEKEIAPPLDFLHGA